MPAKAKKKRFVTLPKTQPVEVEYQFNDSDKLGIGDIIARLVVELNELEDRKKSVVAEFKSAMECKGGELRMLTGKLRRGSELRKVEAVVTLDLEHQSKTFSHPKTMETLKVVAMTAADQQPDLPMDEDAPPTEGAEKN